MKHVLILGAKSDVAIELAKIYAKYNYHLILAARSIDELAAFKESQKETYAISVHLIEFDALAIDDHRSFYENLPIKPYGVISCMGYLGDQQLAEENQEEAQLILNTNLVGCISILDMAARSLELQKQGFIIGVSSVAGERGRKSNYFYGSAKAGLTAYLSGLRARLKMSNVNVLTVKPGFMATKMTAHLQLPKLLTVSAETAAKTIFKAQQKKKNVIYVKWVWRYTMWVIRLLPEFIFKRLDL